MLTSIRLAIKLIIDLEVTVGVLTLNEIAGKMSFIRKKCISYAVRVRTVRPQYRTRTVGLV